MKKAIVLLLVAGLPLQLIAQLSDPASDVVHSVGIDSKDNRIVLSVANASKAFAVDSLSVGLIRCPKTVKVSPLVQNLKGLPPAKEGECLFSFSVERAAKPNAQDTLEFLLSDGWSILGKKTIVLKYEGPAEYLLEQNYPNPFNPRTTIHYQLPTDSRVTLKVYDILGREVKSLFDGLQEAGYQEAMFDGITVASGVYFLRIVAESTVAAKTRYVNVKKMMFLK
jgi:hypothetical protein